MNTIVVTSTKQNIKFGYEGEDNVTKIIFPYDESWLEYGEGNFEVRILRCGDEVAYTATDVVDDRQAMTLTMTVTDIELSVRGRGEMQLCYVCPDSIKKSPIYQYTVNRSVDYKYAVDPPEGSIIASVEKSLSEIKNTTNRLSNSVISIESSIDDVNSQIDNINDKISEFDEEIDSIGEVETRVDNLETSIQSINGKINTAEGNINENTESISDLNESVTELENRKVTDLETSGGRSDSGKYLTVGTDGKIKATSLTIPPTITVDASLSTTSTNPVQNKVIKTELNTINSNIATCNTEISKINGSLDAVVVRNLAENASWTIGKAIQAATGASYNSSGAAHTGFLNVSKCSRIKYMRRYSTLTYTPTAGIAFYDSGYNYISGVSDAYKSSDTIPKMSILTVPENAAYVRATYYDPNSETVANYPFFVYDADLYEAALETKVKQNTDDISAHYNEFIAAFSDLEQINGSLEDVKVDLANSNDGYKTFASYATFANGGLNKGVFKPVETHRVATDTLITASRDLNVTILNGYRIGVHFFVNGIYDSQSGWKYLNYTIPAGSTFKIVISKTPEDTSVVADVDEFINAVTLPTAVKEAIDANKEAIDASLDDLYNGVRTIAVELNNGFIGGDGSINNPTSSNEVYTDAISVVPNESLNIKLHFETGVHSMWIALCYYDISSNFIRRAYIVSSVNQQDYNGKIDIPANTSFIRITFRTFDGAVFSISEDWKKLTALESLLTALESLTYASNTVKSIAHRGDDVDAPQCTAPAYIIARKHGLTIAENDLWYSEDGEYIMWHDTTLERLGELVDINGYLMYTDGTDYYWVNPDTDNVYTYDYTNDEYVLSEVSLTGLTRCEGVNYGVNSEYAQHGLDFNVLRRIDFGVYKGAKFAGTQIMTFEEWVLLCKQLGMEIYVDRKFSWTPEHLGYAANVVKKLGMSEKASWLGIASEPQFNALRAIIDDARCGILQHPNSSNIVTYESFNTGRGFFFDGDGKNMSKTDIQLGLEAGYDVEVYIVDTTSYTKNQLFDVIRTAISYGVTAITLDHFRVEDAFSYLLDEF